MKLIDYLKQYGKEHGVNMFLAEYDRVKNRLYRTENYRKS